jgi:hypothetical protein
MCVFCLMFRRRSCDPSERTGTPQNPSELKVVGIAGKMSCMPLFDTPVPSRLLWPVDAQWPRRRARALLRKFRSAFPQITFDMDLGVRLANAQAFLDGKEKRVRLYGGLVRHRKIGSAGLAVTLAHEVGHHLGGSPFLTSHRWLSSELKATEWASEVGLRKVFGEREAVIRRVGIVQLRTLGLLA